MDELPESAPPVTERQRKEHLSHAMRVFTRACLGAPDNVLLSYLRLGWPRADDPPEQHAAMLAGAALWDAVAIAAQDLDAPPGIERHLMTQCRQVLHDPELRRALVLLAEHRRADVDEHERGPVPLDPH